MPILMSPRCCLLRTAVRACSWSRSAPPYHSAMWFWVSSMPGVAKTAAISGGLPVVKAVVLGKTRRLNLVFIWSFVQSIFSLTARACIASRLSSISSGDWLYQNIISAHSLCHSCLDVSIRLSGGADGYRLPHAIQNFSITAAAHSSSLVLNIGLPALRSCSISPSSSSLTICMSLATLLYFLSLGLPCAFLA